MHSFLQFDDTKSPEGILTTLTNILQNKRVDKGKISIQPNSWWVPKMACDVVQLW